jgi:Rieske Fe-S protein
MASTTMETVRQYWQVIVFAGSVTLGGAAWMTSINRDIASLRADYAKIEIQVRSLGDGERLSEKRSGDLAARMDVLATDMRWVRETLTEIRREVKK